MASPSWIDVGNRTFCKADGTNRVPMIRWTFVLIFASIDDYDCLLSIVAAAASELSIVAAAV
jgi:hypothetical protein